jgi:hypothetical protein
VDEAHFGNLQFLARAEVRKDARLAHARGYGQRAYGQALEPGLGRQMQRRIEDVGLGLLPLVQTTRFAAQGKRWVGQGGRSGHGKE